MCFPFSGEYYTTAFWTITNMLKGSKILAHCEIYPVCQRMNTSIKLNRHGIENKKPK